MWGKMQIFPICGPYGGENEEHPSFVIILPTSGMGWLPGA